MKILRKSLIIQKNEIQHTQTENKVMKMMKHPFITSLIYSFQTVDHLCLVMTYANGGELFFHLSREKRFSEEKSKFYCAEIILALGYLHEYNIMYRDIKLENILLDNEGHIKLADFGLCKMNMTLDSKTHTFCGTPEYLAPEILTNSGTDGYGRAIDWYALGIVLYEMLVGRLPYSNKDVKILFQNIVNQTLELPYYLSLNSKQILSGLLDKDPQKRLGSSALDYKEIQLQSWFSNINWNDLFNRKIQPPFKPVVTSDLDTRYFDKEFTGECVQFTPPNNNNNNNNSINNDSQFDTSLNNKYFDSFSYYGSKTSLTSNTHNSNNNLNNKFDAQSLLQHSTSSLNSSKSSLAHKNESSDNNYYPCLVQYSDNKGQLYESQTYIPMVIDGQAILNNLIKSDYHLYEPSYLAMTTMLNPPKRLKINQKLNLEN
jgi:serine/threonine protein kinase